MRDSRSCPTNGEWSCTLMRCDDDRWCVAMHARCTSSCNTCRVVSITPPSYLIDEILRMSASLSTEKTLLEAPYETADLIVVDRLQNSHRPEWG